MAPGMRTFDSRQSAWSGLVREMAQGNQSALSQLYDQSSGLLYALALRITQNEEDAEEVLHDAYCRAWRTAGRYTDERSTVMSWLALITRSVAIDRLRSLRRHAPASTPISPGTEPLSQDSPEAEASLGQRARRIRVALSGLPGEQRELIELAFFEGLSHSELATSFGLPLGTVKTRIRSGLVRLRESLKELG